VHWVLRRRTHAAKHVPTGGRAARSVPTEVRQAASPLRGVVGVHLVVLFP
jgi:hypothetical protein